MAGMLVLTTMQPIVGVDFHTSLPPIPTAILPHAVVWGTGLSLSMGLPQALTASQAMAPNHPQYGQKPIAAGFGYACGRGHDAGVHFGHIAGNTLLAIIWLGAASKAEFGSGTVLVQGQHMAVNMMLFMNLQLDCSDPVPMPTGFTFATGSNMVFANMTWMDLLNGFVHMLVDIAIVAILNFLLAGVGSVVGRVLKGTGITGILSELAGNAKGVAHDLEDIWLRKLSNGKRVMDWSRLTPKGFAQQFEAAFLNHRWNMEGYNTSIAPKALGTAAKSILPGWLYGSPVGASASQNFSPGSAVAGSNADSGIDSLFYP
jgi:hypothetical protein